MTHGTADDIATINRISAVPAILQVITEMTGMRFAAVARVTQTTWTACAVLDKLGFGLQSGGELDLVSTLCFESMNSHLPIIIDKASADPLYQHHHTPRIYRFESYITIPVWRTDGSFFGTLCALDPEPASLRNSTIQSTMESFARLLSLQIDAEENLQRTETALEQERETAELREQFIAVIGHDLRNPLFAITTAAERLLRVHPDPSTDVLVKHILSCGNRASQLVEDVMDFARGRLGSGIPLTLRECPDLDQVFIHVISELQNVHAQRSIRSDIGPLEGIRCDSGRLAQLLSNLLTNAITHGCPDGPVDISALVLNGVFTLRICNQGEPIPAEQLPHLFKPYSRPATDTPQAGLGLGLYIASQIALSHGGHMEVTSDQDQGTVFTFSMALP
ncbi:sensor histidine kinase [Pseudomonas sp. FSL R10-0056]|uniref:GAF domain-containing sensor histidine kinase n=1 Tax=unclassified Pseudomonas TaxID=196821 RepID=UPI001296C745|nr:MULTISPECIES: GAF domain-containing sensor histidine kinase [unclassified Pseudomonas]MDN5391762.1 GAF domain-containing sensor histidine kinase [Pseudomonas sp.]MDN5393776.1 GAF domain-containing sensor histidine kinase [Pseudomonas sp.]MDN5407579.1 GAF domain-containing sensor histidine kinase [Pseudomonas sp.]MDN5454877.1 GAF domain-containing sensor histidine kinase [Pseudomonas sp.]MDN5458570.1 GAF domain-containing sensor histidine kinase [Pseudomonas sp.]